MLKSVTTLVVFASIIASGGAVAGRGGGVPQDLQCGDVVRDNTVLNTDLICPFADPVLTVVGPATLNLDKHMVSCQGSGHGIILKGNGAALYAGSIVDCPRSIRVDGNRATLAATNIKYTNSIVAEMVVFNGNHNKLANNRITNGAVAVRGDHNFVFRNKLFNASIESVGYGNKLMLNELEGDPHLNPNPQAWGHIGGFSEGATLVIRNKLKGSDATCISVHGIDVRILSNTVRGCAVGIGLGGASDSYVINNSSLQNESFDMNDREGCDNNVWRHNTFDTASADCIR